MRPRRWKALLILMPWVLVQGGSLAAYELRTHGEITRRAFDMSEGVKGYLEAVGIRSTEVLDPIAITPPGQLALFDNTGIPRDWMIEGAIREDDFQAHLGCGQPLNPPSTIDRPLNHFFDVQRGGGGLTVLGLERGFPAPDWALGLQGQGPNPNQNQFSILDARAYQLKSLTARTRDERDRNTALFFRTLGHVIHALEDMGQPQHTRNDPHAGCFQFIAGGHSWFEDYMETRTRGIRYRARGLPSPPLLLDGYSPVAFQAYRDYWTNPGVSGLAELSSRNFFSAGTNLSFRNCDGLLEPPCDPEAYVQRDVTVSALTIKGTTLMGSVRLFNRRMRDPVTGAMVTTRDPVTEEPTEDVAVSSRSVWDQHLERLGSRPVFSLNTLNYDSIGDVLLPRAVGYSAGLLDYFFRAKLDVDLVPADPNDPSVVRVSGANASPDALRGGGLVLYADDPTDPTGKRDPATALDPDVTVMAESGAPIESARFRVPENVERFMAVYKGTLGQEGGTGALPGGVIGKVLGGVRVEEVFSDGTPWKLRTPKGVFLLQGLTVAEFEEVRWGDGDSLLVARTPFGPGQPSRVAAYEVQRQAGSAELVTVDAPGGLEVPLIKKDEAVFPFGMSLGTTVQFSHTIQYRQLVPTFQVTQIYEYVPIPGAPGAINYPGPIAFDFTPLQIETPVNQTVRFAQDFPIRLDLMHHGDFGTAWRPYVWYLQEVAATASGRLLGLVLVFLTEPDVPAVSLPVYGLSNGPEVTGQVGLTPSFPAEVNPLLWAVVDLREGRVLASTAEAVVAISTEEGRETFLEAPLLGAIVAERGFDAYIRGPLAGVYDRGWFALPLVSPEGLAPIGELTELPSSQGGILTISVDGWLRADLKDELGRLGLSAFQVSARQSSGDAVYLCLPTSCKAIRQTTTVGEVVRSPATLEDARRSRPVPGGERLIFLTGSATAGPAVMVWDPETPKARIVHQFSPSEGPVLGPATPTTLMTLSFVLEGEALIPSSVLIPLEGTRGPIAFPGVDLRDSFALLDPRFLYHVGDLKFYRLRPPLQPTALPARLADVPGNPVGDYHAIRLP